MAKKIKTTIEHCGECPFTRHLYADTREIDYCQLTGAYVTMAKYKKEIHELCPLEDV